MIRVHVVDPPAYTPPYDHALCAALARAGADVELVTSRFAYAATPQPTAYRRSERFYRAAAWADGRPWLRRAARAAEHPFDMLAYRRHARAADVVHFQWLTVPALDPLLWPRGRPVVVTAHHVFAHGRAAARAYRRADAVVAHSEHARGRLSALGVDPSSVRVIPHGAFDHLTRVPGARPLPPELPRSGPPVVLCFGLIRPYKGIDVLLEAWRGIEDAELWIVGLPKLDVAPLRAAAPANVRWVTRFVPDEQVAAFFERADVVVLPYRAIDQSGVLFTALAFGRPLVLSAVGGFPEVAATGAAALVAPGDPAALHDALARLLGDPGERGRMAAAARAAARGEYGWDGIAQRTLALYEELTSSDVTVSPVPPPGQVAPPNA